MGLLLKIALITFLLLFVIIKVGNFVFRTFYWMLGTEAMRRQQTQSQPQQKKQTTSQRPRAGNINVEPIPEPEAQRRSKGYGGGEYVEYEEVK